MKPSPSPLSPLLWIIHLALASALSTAAAEQKPLWVVIGHQDLHPGVQALADHRRSEDAFEVALARPPIETALASLPRPPAYILLLGDDRLPELREETALPGKRFSLYRWRATQPETYVSDSVHGDLDGDGIPEIPVGRLPGRTPAEIARLAAKIVAFEKLAPTLDSLHLPVWAGNPAYGDKFETNLASNLLRQTLHLEAPAWADLTLIMGNITDPLSAVPSKQAAIFNKLLTTGGGLFTGMMGHGGTEAFFSMPHHGRWVGYDGSHAQALSGKHPSAPTIIFACDCGNFAHAKTSLAESLIHSPSGPVAVIAATTQSHPMPNYYSSVCWLQGVEEKSDRLGDLWVVSQKRGYEMRNPLAELFLKEVEGKLETELNTPRIRKDHLLLYALLGDPATRLKRPRKLEATFVREGDSWTWSVPNPPAGAKRLLIGHRIPPPPLKPKPDGLTEEETMALFRQSNAGLRFSQVEERRPVSQWTGQFQHRRGTLRLVVETDEAFFVQTQALNSSP